MKLSKRLLISISLIAVLTIAISASAYAYYFIYLPSTIVYTAVTADVQYYEWSGGAKRNNITLSFNFAANVTTYEANATWGIRNSGANPKTVENWIVAITDTAKVTNVTIQILTQNGVTSKAVMQWVTGDPAPPTTHQSWSASATTNYMLRIWCTGATSVANIQVTLGLETIEV